MGAENFAAQERALQDLERESDERPEPVNPMSPEEKASLAEWMAAWDEAKDRPEWKEMFAREIFKRGDITIKERNRLIEAAYYQPNITDADREAAAQRLALLFKAYVPKEKWSKLSGLMEDCISGGHMGKELAIAFGDLIEARQHANDSGNA